MKVDKAIQTETVELDLSKLLGFDHVVSHERDPAKLEHVMDDLFVKKGGEGPTPP